MDKGSTGYRLEDFEKLSQGTARYAVLGMRGP